MDFKFSTIFICWYNVLKKYSLDPGFPGGFYLRAIASPYAKKRILLRAIPFRHLIHWYVVCLYHSFLVFTVCKLRKFKILKTLNNVKWPSINLKSKEITSFHFHSCICCINLLVTVQNYRFFKNGKVFAKQLRCTQFCAIPQNSAQ